MHRRPRNKESKEEDSMWETCDRADGNFVRVRRPGRCDDSRHWGQERAGCKESRDRALMAVPEREEVLCCCCWRSMEKQETRLDCRPLHASPVSDTVSSIRF